jgi:hypothetical protein
LRGDDRRRRREHQQRHASPFGREQVERILDRRGIAEDQRALAEIVEQERREYEKEPRAADRPLAEMAHVRVERLDARDRQHDGAERDERDGRVARDEARGVHRVDRDQHAGPAQHLAPAEHREDDEPQRHHRPEHRTELAGAAALHGEQDHEDDDADGHDERMKRGHDDAEALHRAEHGNRRRDHAVAVEHRRPEDAEAEQPPPQPILLLDAARHERRQREDAAFAAVVGPHDQRDVLERHHDDQRPQERRQDAEDVRRGYRQAELPGEGRAQRVERARADVAVDDADRADDEWQHLPVRTGGFDDRIQVRARRDVRRRRCRPCGAKSGC